jgi:hypothetical protein
VHLIEIGSVPRSRSTTVSGRTRTLARNTVKMGVSETVAAKCAATRARRPSFEDGIGPELGGIIDEWPTLPEAVKRGIGAMVDAASGH